MIRAKAQLQLVAGKEPEERIVQPELNLEQWPLFTPSHARGREYTVRTVEHTKTLPNGDRITHAMDVGFCEFGTLTARDQRVLYALFQIWKEQGSPLGEFPYSIHRLAQLLNLQEGKATHHSIRASLRRLHGVALTFRYCFFNAETGGIDEDEEPLHILSKLSIKIRKRRDNGTYEQVPSKGFVAFNPRIVKNLIKHYTRPVLFDVVLSFTSDTAQLLYALVDRQLATKDSYTKVTITLLPELGLTGKDYQYPSARKRALDKPVAELVGKPLSSGGVIASATIEPTADLSDYKVIFTKQATSRAAARKLEEETARKLANTAARKPPVVPVTPRALDAAETELLNQLRAYGITAARARQLVLKHRAAAERELHAFPFRDKAGIKDAAAWLIRAIESGDYSAPPKLTLQEQPPPSAPAAAPDNQQAAYEAYLRRELLALETRCPAALRAFAEEFTEIYAFANIELRPEERPAAELACFGQFVVRYPDLQIKSFHAWLRNRE